MTGIELLNQAERLNRKVNTLVEKHRKLLEELETLKEENRFLKLQCHNQLETDSRESLNQQIIHLTQSLTQGKEKAEVRNTINEIVREIDRCIGLLNQPEPKV